MSYLGSWAIDSVLTFPAITHRFDTGALTDADAAPSYRVYEDETATALLTGSMALLDTDNTTGFYSEAITLSAANGFELGKSYTIYITAAVNSVTGGQHHTFQIGAQVNATHAAGTAWGSGAITAASIATDAIGSAEFSQAAADKVWSTAARILTAATNVTSTGAAVPITGGGLVSADVTAISTDTAAADNAESYFDGTGYAGLLQRTTIATLASQTSFTLTAGSADNSAYVGCRVVIQDASTAAQKAAGIISAYTGATKTVTLAADPGIFTIATTDIVNILEPIDVARWLGVAPNVLVSGRVDADVGAVAADAITAAAIANGAIDAATFAAGAIDAAALAADAGTEIGTAVWATATRALTVLDEDSTTLDLDATIRAAVGLATANLDTQLDALPTAAEVNAEVVDALATDTYAEPGQGTPAATTTLAAKINYLYKFLRNRRTQTSTQFSVYADDATTVDHKATVSDDGVTYDRTELATGP